MRVPPPEDKGDDGFRPNQAIDPNDYRFYSFVPDEITPETGYQPQPQKPIDRNPGGRRKQDNRYNRSANKTPMFLKCSQELKCGLSRIPDFTVTELMSTKLLTTVMKRKWIITTSITDRPARG